MTMVWQHSGNIQMFVNGHKLPDQASCALVRGDMKYTSGIKEVKLGSIKWAMLFDEVAIWYKALSDEEAEDIFHRTLTGKYVDRI